MSHVNTIFNQLLHLFPRHDFDRHVKAYEGNKNVRTFTCWNQFITLMYAQAKGHDSIRDIITGIKANSGKWYHIGLTEVARSTLSDANGNRDWRIYEGLFYDMLAHCKSVTPNHNFKFKNPLYSLDSSVIDLCLSLFPWAEYKTTKGALKLHCLLDHRGCIPSFIHITEGKHHDVKVAKTLDLPLPPDSILAIDRGYIDFKYLHKLHNDGVFFVTRAKSNMNYEITGQHKMPNKKGLIDDVSIMLCGYYQKQYYPQNLRLVTWRDEEKNRDFLFLTNNFKLAASTIAAIYKARWQVELFFKWIKQNLKIKSFLGTSRNAVMTQIWVAMSYFLLLTYVKFQTRYKYSKLHLARLFKETLMEKMSLIHLLSLDPDKGLKCIRPPTMQLNLF